MKKPNSTCKGCKKRTLGCHDTCEEYKAFKEAMREYRKTINANAEQDIAFNAYASDRDNNFKSRKNAFQARKFREKVKNDPRN